jgi:hypothetical protein
MTSSANARRPCAIACGLGLLSDVAFFMFLDFCPGAMSLLYGIRRRHVNGSLL